jgi:hypothetical protein
MSTLSRAIEIAVIAHAGQTDKAGAPYILHPLRVMLALQGDEDRIVGVLHDVVEDCPGWTPERLRGEGFTEAVLTALAHVTKLPGGEDYPAFIDRCCHNPVARRVKRADLLDNLDVRRLPQVTDRDSRRLNRYLSALAQLDAWSAP